MRKKFVSIVSLSAMAVTGWFGITATPPAGAAAAAQTGFTVATKGTNEGALFSIDLATGTPTEIGQTGQNDIEGLAMSCDGKLYGINRVAKGTTQPNQLVMINTTTGAATVVGPLTVEPADAGLTFGTDGKLYMAEVNTGQLYVIDTATAAVTTIGPLGGSVEVTGLATRADGTVFGYDRKNFQLVTVNITTGAATPVGPASDLNLIGLDFDAAGTLWGISETGAIVNFDTTTGNDTQVSTYDTSDNRFVSLAIAPEGCAPATTTTAAATSTASSTPSASPASSSVAAKSSSSSSTPVALIAIGMAAVVAILLFVVLRRRRVEDQ